MLWILLWAVISAGLIVIFFITLGASLLQVRAWKNFSAKTGLEFKQDNILQPPALVGSYQGYDVRLYTMYENNSILRRKDSWSFTEVDLKAHPDAPFVIAKSSYQGQLHSDDREKFTVEGLHTSVCEAQSISGAEKFLTKSRKDVLQELWSIDNLDPMLMNNDKACTIIVRTSDPLAHPKELNDHLKSLIAVATKMDGSKTTANKSRKTKKADAKSVE